MALIKCNNNRCSSPNRKFQWDVSKYGEGIATPGDKDAKSMIVTCPYCRFGNIVWIKGLKESHTPTRE